MRILTTFTFFLFWSTIVIGQQHALSKQAIIKQNGNWIKMLPNNSTSANDFFQRFQTDLGLDQNYKFQLVDQKLDLLGYTHYRYQQYFYDKPIEGGKYLLHVKDGKVVSGNGKIIRDLVKKEESMISPTKALELAKKHTGAQNFYWEIPIMEERIKSIKADEQATFYPLAELVYADAAYSSSGASYQLAWKYEIYTASPDGKEIVFIDASDGSVLHSLEGCNHGSVEGVAETRYHGSRTIITDSISPMEYRLVDATRGGGIETYNMQTASEDFSSAVDFFDEDNIWNNANENMDDAATDVHWGSEQTYDYFLNMLDRDSYDDEGSPIISYVHVGNNVFNASWNGMFAQYGDGANNPLTSIDIVAHELTHGVTGTSAKLIYQDESGALNESFSDIFGTAIEHYALGDSANWTLGLDNFALRDMANPNLFDDPDTYRGTHWWYEEGDFGGVHHNSGVQNFWFYLLSNGGEGTNDKGNTYSVDSIGMDKAAKIAYRNLTVYLTESSNYLDARLGAIQAAEDLYGSCSNEVLQVAQAWYAVGVGSATIAPDLQVVEVQSPLESGCELSAAEQISMLVRFNPAGCELSIEAGEELELSYRINARPRVYETMVLTETLSDGDLFSFDFQTPADLSEKGQYYIDYTVNYGGDLIESNNEIPNHRLTNTIITRNDNKIAFERSNSRDSIYIFLGKNAEGDIERDLGVDGTKGFLMNGFGASFDNITPLETEENNFTANPNFISKLCTCVDLTEWTDDAVLNFDLQQTYSSDYQTEFDVDFRHMISFRVLVNGLQIGEQYHPETNYEDEFETQVIDFSEYIGTSFDLCFEGVNFINWRQDWPDLGDSAILDNVYFSEPVASATKEASSSQVTLFPNPTNGALSVKSEMTGAHDIEILDLMGKVVQSHRYTTSKNPFTLDLSALTKGVYLISLRTKKGMIVHKVVVN